MNNKVYFIGAGPGDPDLITIKAKNIIEKADVILYTGSLVPKEVLKWAKESCFIKSSEKMAYEDIYEFYNENIDKGLFVRLHTGDPSIYSTIAKQIEFLKTKNIEYEVIPGVTAGFAGAASTNIEFTLPGVSQTVILSRIAGRTPNPEALENILACKHSSIVFYLSVRLLEQLEETALRLGYPKDTPCWILEKVSWPEERVIKGSLSNIKEKVKEAGIKGTALIFFGEYLNQKEKETSHLYNDNPEIWKP